MSDLNGIEGHYYVHKVFIDLASYTLRYTLHIYDMKFKIIHERTNNEIAFY